MFNRSRRVVLAAVLAAGLSSVGSGILSAQEFPSRPIEFIVPWGPGGGADQVARKLAKLMEPRLKVSMPVINVPGATGQTGLTKMLTGPADGYAISAGASRTGPTSRRRPGRSACAWASPASAPTTI